MGSAHNAFHTFFLNYDLNNAFIHEFRLKLFNAYTAVKSIH
jgi:hypothetical protein